MIGNETKLVYTGFNDHAKTFFITGSRTVIVDTSTPGNSGNILQSMSRNGIDPEQVSLIILTHAHLDHFGSAKELSELLQVPIAMGRADSIYISEGRSAPIVPHSAKGVARLRETEGNNADMQMLTFNPDILFEDDISLAEYGVDADVLMTPGHTFGSVSVAVRGGDCAIGDLLTGEPPSNVPEFPIFAEDTKAVWSSLKKVLEYGPTGLCPGHGQRIGAADARKKFAGMLS
ncbi:MAG TPA: MBL fold metallo-hydrolase [Methanocella sp.]|nr:MBL fold metallo-hydrolase [Methanocella sp.]